MLGHRLPAGPGRAVVEHRTGLGGEVLLSPARQVTAGVTPGHGTLPTLYGRVLRPRPEYLGGGVVGDLPVLVVLLRLAVRVAAGLCPLARDVDAPLDLTASRLLPGGRPLQLGAGLQVQTVTD